MTLIELITVVGLLSVILGTAMAAIPRGTYDLWAAQSQFLGDIRMARTLSLTKGDHFRLVVTGANTYDVRRMQLQGGVWVDRVQPPVRSRMLRDGITFTEGAGAVYEFNTRGLLVNPDLVQDVALSDTRTGKTRGVTVWPSGQVAPEHDGEPA